LWYKIEFKIRLWKIQPLAKDTLPLFERLKNVIKEEVTASERRVKSELRQEIIASEERLTQKIEASQEETIDVLSEVIHTRYNMHEKRVSAVEAQLDIPNKNEAPSHHP
jgi:hypothetical protein